MNIEQKTMTGNRVREYMRARGLNGPQVAAVLGIAYITFWKKCAEKNNRHFNPHERRALARLFGVRVADLFPEDDPYQQEAR
jgi:transcriptional regulator with XRE-family HTH domain